MKKEIKEKWIAGLRSGTYKQGTNCLCLLSNDEHMFCAIGVLIDVIDPGKWVAHSWLVDENAYQCSYNGYARDIPENKRKEIDLSVEDKKSIFEFNDRTEMSFDEIADWIEENICSSIDD